MTEVRTLFVSGGRERGAHNDAIEAGPSEGEYLKMELMRIRGIVGAAQSEARNTTINFVCSTVRASLFRFWRAKHILR